MGKNMNIKKGDTVKVIAGKDKGAQGKVISVLREEERVHSLPHPKPAGHEHGHPARQVPGRADAHQRRNRS